MHLHFSKHIALLLFCCSTFLTSHLPAKEGLQPDRAWTKLLLYTQRNMRTPTSIVDTPDYFLSPVGMHDPSAELRAVQSALAAFPRVPTANSDVLCKFPARSEAVLLERGHAHIEVDTALSRCQAYSSWRADLAINRVSLVFSSYFVNNPASMFGHTFLRLHRGQLQWPKEDPDRTRTSARASSPLLDFALNFAANPTSLNPLVYVTLGLAGGFKGTFSLMPYYLKVQEYNNFESRDLWEYELSLAPEEIDRLLKVLWEVGPHWIDYYYFDENCSFVLLTLLEAAAPRLDLTDRFRFFATPGDTLLSADRVDGFLQAPQFRPASRYRYTKRYEALSKQERAVFEALLASSPEYYSATLDQLPSTSSKARTLDVAIEFITYKDNLTGSQTSKTFASLHDWSLMTRASLAVKSPQIADPDAIQAPHNAPPPALIHLALGRDSDGSTLGSLRLRPVLYDMKYPARGFSETLEIAMGDLTLSVNDKYPRKPLIEHFALFHSISLSPLNEPDASVSWQLDVQSETAILGSRSRRTFGQRHSINAGVGGAVAKRRRWSLHALAGAFAGYCSDALSSNDSGHGCLGPWLTSGASLSLTPEDKVTASTRWDGLHAFDQPFSQIKTMRSTRLTWTHLWPSDYESSVELHIKEAYSTYLLGFGSFL